MKKEVTIIRSAIANLTRMITFGSVISVLLLAGCQPVQKSGGNYKPTTADTRLAQAYNEFGFELYRKMAAAEPGGNLFMSPASVAIALSMTINGAIGPTRDGMAKALHLNSLTPADINAGSQKLQEALEQADPKVQLSIANSIWAHEGVKFEQAFLQTNKDYYDAQTSVLNFADKRAADKINKWVDKETKGKIDKIVESPINENTVMFLLNAVYFKGDWTVPFDKLSTSDQPFILNNGTRQNRSMMARQGNFEYADLDGYQAVRLPYGDGNTGMVVLLPDEGKKLVGLGDQLSNEEWVKLTGKLKEQQGKVIMPRFKLEYEASVKKTLKSLGMSQAFDENEADFSGLLTPPARAFLSDVKHKTFVQVDEKGTEAAAVTKVEVRATSAEAPSGFQMNINRPFLFIIHEQTTGAILFVGSISDPQL